MLKIGDKVTLRSDSDYYYEDLEESEINWQLPRGVVGTITETFQNEPRNKYEVAWEDRCGGERHNNYAEEDLDLEKPSRDFREAIL